ncbi:hypothetical protein ACFFGH_18385 [Lysobacter korlensis]|uniref:G domain-containing protein n=1 Tax=Lysobacter korlensis TaxID=553636 RepID=A0ABV6RTR3_9GAMM
MATRSLKHPQAVTAAPGADEARHVYSAAAGEIERILGHLGEASADEEVAQAKHSAIESLRPTQDRLQHELSALEADTDWKTFTIAFYGETNAGKSTLIESLRIALGEPTKMASQTRFRELQDQEGLTPEKIDAAAQAVTEAGAVRAQREAERSALQHVDAASADSERAAVAELEAVIARNRAQASVWTKIIFLFRPMPELRQLADLQKRHAAEATSRAEARARAGRAVDEAQRDEERAKNALARRQAALAELAAYADGGIIGNGQSDFTLEATSYAFSASGQPFALIDVPGIEGKEARVMEAILSSVRKAHAVFYVTDKPAPPQKGQPGNPGTLEKIKGHLAAHTEVWTVYNKRATNPAALADALLNDDEKLSLDGLDTTMRSELGDAYQRTVGVSAKPAFYGVATCLVPGSPDERGQAKFLARIDRAGLLQRSNLAGFRHLLEGDLVRGHERKIRRSNFNKALKVVEEAQAALEGIQKKLVPMEKKLHERTEDARLQIRSATNKLRTRLDTQVQGSVDEFATRVREAIYARIKSDIDNDTFKQALEAAFAAEQAWLEEQLPARFEAELTRLQKQIADVVSRLEEQTQELAALFAVVDVGGSGRGFELKLDLDSGLKVGALVSTLVGAALLWWNPAGWVIVALGAFTAVISLYKAVRGFFSSDYRKGQQRKAADENIDRVVEQMRSSLGDNLKDGLPALEQKVDEIDEALGRPVAELRSLNASLRRSLKALEELSGSIKAQGEK